MKLYIEMVNDDGVTAAVFENYAPLCEDCKYFREDPLYGHHGCVHPDAMAHPAPDSWCACGKEKDHE